MITEVAFCDDQLRVEEPFVRTIAGFAVNVSVGATCVTVMVTVALMLPPGPVAVKVYVVVAAGVTGMELAVTNGCSEGSVRGSGEILIEVALVTDQVRVAIDPAVIVVGAAENAMTGGPGLTATVTLAVVLPPPPVAVRV
jgi:hypothetical protein